MKQSIVEEKAALRRRLGGVVVVEAAARAEVLCEVLLGSIREMQGVQSIGLYAAIADEPDLVKLAAALGDYAVFYPQVKGDEMLFRRVKHVGELRRGRWGIAEPGGDAPVCEVLDLMICPGVAFTRCGLRMGKGRGFYDRYLGQVAIKPLLWGVQYAERIVCDLPHDLHDVRMDRVFVC